MVQLFAEAGSDPAGFRLQGFDCCLPVLGGRREQVDRVRRQLLLE